MIALKVGLNCMTVNMVAVHHFFVAVALDAGINVEHAAFNSAGWLNFLDAVQTVTISTTGGIRVAFHQRHAVNRVQVHLLVFVTFNTGQCGSLFITFFRAEPVNVRVAGSAGQTFLGMDALGKLFGFIPVTTGTVDLFQLGVAGHVLLQVGTLQVAAGAAVFAMGGCGKTVETDLSAVATQTVLRVIGHFVHSSVEHAWQHEQH